MKYQTLGMMYFFLFEVFYCASIIPIKLSIALMLIRNCVSTESSARRIAPQTLAARPSLLLDE